MKKFKVLFVLGLILISACAISCKKKNTTSKINMNSDTNLLGFYSLSSAKILSINTVEQTQNVRSKKSAKTTTESSIDMAVVNEYMQMMESMFSESEPIITKNEISDRVDFEQKLVFEVTGLTGVKETYVIYYTQQEVVEHGEEDEKEYRLSGLAIIEGVEYQIIGEKELEEGEERLDITIKVDNNNYVVIEQEIENGEQEYEYEIYRNGRKYKSISFEIENDREFEAEFITNENGYTEKYRFYKDGKQVVIKYQSKEQSFTIKATATIDSTTGETVYSYRIIENNQEYKF